MTSAAAKQLNINMHQATDRECGACLGSFYNKSFCGTRGLCIHCRNTTTDKFSLANEMQPGPLPDDCFQDITIAEQALICKMQCFVSLLHLKHGQYAMSGNTIFFWQNLQATATVLPRQQCDIIVFGKLRSGGRITELKVRRHKVEQCLQYLVANNPFYNNIVKDQTILNSFAD